MAQAQQREDARDIVQVRDAEVARSEPTSLMEAITRAAADPAVDVNKLERLFAMHERISANHARVAYYAALAEMQPKLPTIDEHGAIKNNAGAVQSRYALWEDISEAIRPVLAAHGFALTFRVGNTQAGVRVTGILSHREGHHEETVFELMADTSGSKNAVQSLGSSTSYGKRYTAMALLNITSRAPQDRDDDGQAGGARNHSAGTQAAIAAINMCSTPDELREWKTKNVAALNDLPPDEADAVVRVWNARAKRLKDAAQ
jgi:hypothetical protein